MLARKGAMRLQTLCAAHSLSALIKKPKEMIRMSEAKAGDTVRMNYTGTLNNGETFDSSEGRDPLEFVVGSGQIIAGLDAAIAGMTVGDKKDVNVPCAQAYGDVNADARQVVPREQIPAEIPLEIGTQRITSIKYKIAEIESGK